MANTLQADKISERVTLGVELSGQRKPVEIATQTGVPAKTLRRDLELLQRLKTLCETGRLD